MRMTAGSGSAYIYGYCDANYRPDMTQAECEEFVKNGAMLLLAAFDPPDQHSPKS